MIQGEAVVRSNFRSERIRIAFNPLENVFEVASAATDRDPSFIPDISRLWSDDTDLFHIADDYLQGLRSAREISEDEVKSIRGSIVKLQGLSNFPFTALQLAHDISEENVADVFVRINSQGKTLSQADFILTLMSVFWDEGRTHLEDFCKDSLMPTTGASSSYNHFIEPSPDQLLRVDVGLAFKRAELEHVYSMLRGKDLATKEFSVDRRGQQFEKLREAQSKVLNLQYWHDFMQCLKRAGYRTKRMISSQNALLYSYILYLIGRTEFHVNEHELRSVIAQWFFMSTLTGRYTRGSESGMESDLAMLRDVTNVGEFTIKLRQTCNVVLTTDFWEVALPNELATSSARSPSLFAYEAALILLDAPALFSEFKIGYMMDPSVSPPRKPIERHHLFPRGYLERLGISQTRDQNQIANYAYVEWLDNVAISDVAPSEYLPPMKSRFSETDVQKMYRLHALPADWENLDYKAFLEERRGLMAQIIREGYETLISDARVIDKPYEIDLVALMSGGESDAVEFKSTLRVNLHTRQQDSRIELSILKTLAGFLNTNGGTLFVGVSEDGTPLGLEDDGFPDDDQMTLHLNNVVNRSMGPGAWALMHANFNDHEAGRVLVVRCEKHRSPVYVTDRGGVRHFYIRTGPSTAELSISEAQEYITQKFG